MNLVDKKRKVKKTFFRILVILLLFYVLVYCPIKESFRYLPLASEKGHKYMSDTSNTNEDELDWTDYPNFMSYPDQIGDVRMNYWRSLGRPTRPGGKKNKKYTCLL